MIFARSGTSWMAQAVPKHSRMTSQSERHVGGMSLSRCLRVRIRRQKWLQRHIRSHPSPTHAVAPPRFHRTQLKSRQ